MTTDLADLLGMQETAALEFKGVAKDRDAIRKAICALANDLCRNGGGDLLVGVRKDGTPAGDIDTSDEALLNLAQIRDEGRILDRPSMTVETARYRGKRVVRIHVEASRTPPVRFDGVAWVRPGPLTKRATHDDERVLTERRRTFALPYDSHPVGGSGLDDLDRELFRSTYLPSAVDVSVIDENDRSLGQQMASLRVIDPVGVPTVLGLLLVGLDPSRYLPGGYIQFARFRGVDPGAPVIDEHELRHNVIDMASRLEALLSGHLHVRLVETSAFREERRPEIPLEALREVCMNAIMHRNYESSNAPVRILWFDDRVEVTNPGGPYGQVRADNFRRVNDYRNPSLAAAMKSLGYVNRFGRGIGRVYAALEHNGNPPPDFDVDESSWSVVLRCAE